ncbi:lysosomal beta glucosidase-like [Camellia sinensis]|uniref:lysosomal beta glucosidase-like n=1 Tax=Camellia sinensis TaxID=4442 RepID=UPI0010363382|nr:lysosomal beta glucosidase-like [Camellia sinensis]
MINRFQNAALESRLGIPLLYGTDAVHGNNNVYGATVFPHNIGLGATRDAELVRRIGVATALEVRARGAQFTFAPCVAVSSRNFLY